MKTHNAIIYHCVACGRVVHAEMKAKPPLCCGRTMAEAGAEPIREADATRDGSAVRPESDPAAIKGDRKPR